MYHCLHIFEVLGLIFKFVQGSRGGRKTLAALARTCRLFSSPALDLLWHDLDTIDPLLGSFPIATSFADDQRWMTFRKYAKRVQKTMHACEAEIPAQLKQEFISTLQRCPKAYLPLLPNATKLEWSTFQDSNISLLAYFAGPAVTTISFHLMGWPHHSSAELAGLADLPRLCLNVISCTIISYLSKANDLSPEVGQVVTQWPRLQTLRTCAVAQPVMDQLFFRSTLKFLYIDYHKSLPLYIGRIPDTVREFKLSAEGSSLCMRFLETVYASPTNFHLRIYTSNGREEPDIEAMFHLLPRRLDISRLLSLTIEPRETILGQAMRCALEFREPLVSALAEFTALHELDLDGLCTLSRVVDPPAEPKARECGPIHDAVLASSKCWGGDRGIEML